MNMFLGNYLVDKVNQLWHQVFYDVLEADVNNNKLSETSQLSVTSNCCVFHHVLVGQASQSSKQRVEILSWKSLMCPNEMKTNTTNHQFFCFVLTSWYSLKNLLEWRHRLTSVNSNCITFWNAFYWFIECFTLHRKFKRICCEHPAVMIASSSSRVLRANNLLLWQFVVWEMDHGYVGANLCSVEDRCPQRSLCSSSWMEYVAEECVLIFYAATFPPFLAVMVPQDWIVSMLRIVD